MAKDFNEFVALLKDEQVRDRINEFAESLQEDGEPHNARVAKLPQRRAVAIIREYHNWVTS